MGYDLHITRAFTSFDSSRYPILLAEVVAVLRDEPDLVVPDDAPCRADLCFVEWTAGEGGLMFDNGRLRSKNPREEFIRRMTELASRLDAWVIGDDGEVFERDGEQVVRRQRGPGAFVVNARYLTRGTPIRPEEWERLAAAEPDFRTMARIEATVPSGRRWIACPPVACWTGHPSGRVVPFFHDEDVIEVRHADEPTIRRMRELAPALAATVVDDEDRPA
ncbi:hypothetical protein [Actinoplanes sp. NPDC051411]|uniref:hypothetical protein n=1 Tax=Actinoplanes sp. NPDC051411 TaxID=3155522 RepID=UPI003426F3A2